MGWVGKGLERKSCVCLFLKMVFYFLVFSRFLEVEEELRATRRQLPEALSNLGGFTVRLPLRSPKTIPVCDAAGFRLSRQTRASDQSATAAAQL